MSMCLLVVALALLLCCYQVLPGAGAVVSLGVECHLSYHVVWQGQQPARQVWLPALPAKQPVGEGHAAVTECPLDIQGCSFVLATGCCVVKQKHRAVLYLITKESCLLLSGYFQGSPMPCAGPQLWFG